MIGIDNQQIGIGLSQTQPDVKMVSAGDLEGVKALVILYLQEQKFLTLYNHLVSTYAHYVHPQYQKEFIAAVIYSCLDAFSQPYQFKKINYQLQLKEKQVNKYLQIIRSQEQSISITETQREQQIIRYIHDYDYGDKSSIEKSMKIFEAIKSHLHQEYVQTIAAAVIKIATKSSLTSVCKQVGACVKSVNHLIKRININEKYEI